MLNLPIRRGLHNVQPSIFLCVFPLCLFGLLLFASWRVTDVLLIIPLSMLKSKYFDRYF